MSKIFKNLFIIIFLSLLSSCSLDNKTGIWSGGVDEKRRVADLEKQQKQRVEVVKVYSSTSEDHKEIIYNKNIKLSSAKKNLSWEMSNLNQQNFLGHLFFSGENKIFLKKKVGKNKFDISKNISSPLVYDDNIFFSDNTGTVFSVNQNGKINWKKNIYKKIYKKLYKKLSFIIYDNNIFVSDNVGFTYSLDLQTGELVWIKNLNVPIKSNIKIFEDKIFLVNQDNRILCLSINKGSLIWDIRLPASFIKSQNFLALSISKKGNLLVLNSSGDLLNILIKKGVIIWSIKVLSSMYSHDTDFFRSSEIVISDNNIFFSTTDNLFSVNLNTGVVNWKKEVNSISTPIVDGNNIFVISENGYFINYDIYSGKIFWSTNILKVLKRKKQNTKITGFVFGSNKIYATTSNGFLIISSALSGKVESFKKIGGTINSSPIISNGNLYFLTNNSKIYGIR